MIIATLAALYQIKIKRLLAYSAIGHIGYTLIGFATGTTLGIQGLLLYMVIYIIMTLNIFSLVLAIRKEGDTKDSTKEAQVKYITDLGSLSKTNPVLAITLAITLFSMAGIPPLAGFYSKLYLFFAAIESHMYLLALVGVLTSVVGCVYYIRLIKIMYFEKMKKWTFYKQMDREKSLIAACSCFFMLFFFIHPTPIFIVTHKAALTLCL
jgi:NADH-quinone oxidoreductase subunit N